MASARQTRPMVYQVKVVLRDSKPPIWRRVQLRGETALDTFHKILQTLMGWTDSYPHLFIIDRTFYGKPDLESPFEVKDEKDFTLNSLFAGRKKRFAYEYDFEDCWQHELLIEEVITPKERLKYPVCLGGKRAYPPEDCGGIWEYTDILEAIEDPKHPEYYNMLRWVENGLDPDSFNLEEINLRLRKIE
jgi:hypothetical protein